MNFNYINCLGIFFVIHSILITTLVIHRANGEECVCNARFVGEYCGSELAGSNCSKELIYFCGKSNLRGKTAIALRACSEKGYECSSKENKDNPCFQNLHCNCGENNSRRKKYCGSQLIGQGCKPNIVYKCPMFRGNKLQVEDACPTGCQNGKCI